MSNEKPEPGEGSQAEAEDLAQFADRWLRQRSEAWTDVIQSIDKWVPVDDPHRDKITEVAKKLASYEGDPLKWFKSEEEMLALARFMMIVAREFVEHVFPALRGTPEAEQLEYWFFRAFTMGYKHALG